MALDRRDEIERLFRRYGRGVGSYVLTRVGDPELAEEITARVFLKVVRCLEQLRGQEAGWLFAIVRNELARHFRARDRHTPIAPDTPAPDMLPPEYAAQSEMRCRMQAALGQLSPRDQQLVYLKFFQQLRNPEIANATGLSVSNVGVALHRAIKQLRRLLLPEPTHGQTCEKRDTP